MKYKKEKITFYTKEDLNKLQEDQVIQENKILNKKDAAQHTKNKEG